MNRLFIVIFLRFAYETSPAYSLGLDPSFGMSASIMTSYPMTSQVITKWVIFRESLRMSPVPKFILFIQNYNDNVTIYK